MSEDDNLTGYEGVSFEDLHNRRINLKLKELDTLRERLVKRIRACKELVAKADYGRLQAELDRDKAEAALRSVNSEFVRVRDRLHRAEAYLKSLGFGLDP